MSQNKSSSPSPNFLSQPLSLGSFGRKLRYPEKKRMNLYVKVEDDNSMSRVLPLAVILIIIIGLFTKFAVIDRLTAVNELRSQVNAAQQQYDSVNSVLAGYDEVKEKYYRYTGKYLSEEETDLRDRLEILDVLQSAVKSYGKIESVSISSNTATVALQAGSLEDIANITETLRGDVRVLNVNMENADKSEADDSGASYVATTLVVNFVGLNAETEEVAAE